MDTVQADLRRGHEDEEMHILWQLKPSGELIDSSNLRGRFGGWRNVPFDQLEKVCGLCGSADLSDWGERTHCRNCGGITPGYHYSF